MNVNNQKIRETIRLLRNIKEGPRVLDDDAQVINQAIAVFEEILEECTMAGYACKEGNYSIAEDFAYSIAGM